MVKLVNITFKETKQIQTFMQQNTEVLCFKIYTLPLIRNNYVDCIYLAHNTDQWQATVNMVKCRLHKTWGIS